MNITIKENENDYSYRFFSYLTTESGISCAKSFKVEFKEFPKEEFIKLKDEMRLNALKDLIQMAYESPYYKYAKNHGSYKQ